MKMPWKIDWPSILATQKRHVVVDTTGMILGVLVTAANLLVRLR
jgi:hypothetical protein